MKHRENFTIIVLVIDREYILAPSEKAFHVISIDNKIQIQRCNICKPR
jgi:hypothetical protein